MEVSMVSKGCSKKFQKSVLRVFQESLKGISRIFSCVREVSMVLKVEGSFKGVEGSFKGD